MYIPERGMEPTDRMDLLHVRLLHQSFDPMLYHMARELAAHGNPVCFSHAVATEHGGWHEVLLEPTSPGALWSGLSTCLTEVGDGGLLEILIGYVGSLIARLRYPHTTMHGKGGKIDIRRMQDLAFERMTVCLRCNSPARWTG
jgi:hypothetical protein